MSSETGDHTVWRKLIEEQKRCKVVEAELEVERERARRGADAIAQVQQLLLEKDSLQAIIRGLQKSSSSSEVVASTVASLAAATLATSGADASSSEASLETLEKALHEETAAKQAEQQRAEEAERLIVQLQQEKAGLSAALDDARQRIINLGEQQQQQEKQQEEKKVEDEEEDNKSAASASASASNGRAIFDAEKRAESERKRADAAEAALERARDEINVLQSSLDVACKRLEENARKSAGDVTRMVSLQTEVDSLQELVAAQKNQLAEARKSLHEERTTSAAVIEQLRKQVTEATKLMETFTTSRSTPRKGSDATNKAVGAVVPGDENSVVSDNVNKVAAVVNEDPSNYLRNPEQLNAMMAKWGISSSSSSDAIDPTMLQDALLKSPAGKSEAAAAALKALAASTPNRTVLSPRRIE